VRRALATCTAAAPLRAPLAVQPAQHPSHHRSPPLTTTPAHHHHPPPPPGPRRWALGVLLFELCGGLPPFYCEDKLAMYQRILHAKYAFPQHFSKVGRACAGAGQPGGAWGLVAGVLGGWRAGWLACWVAGVLGGAACLPPTDARTHTPAPPCARRSCATCCRGCWSGTLCSGWAAWRGAQTTSRRTPGSRASTGAPSRRRSCRRPTCRRCVGGACHNLQGAEGRGACRPLVPAPAQLPVRSSRCPGPTPAALPCPCRRTPQAAATSARWTRRATAPRATAPSPTSAPACSRTSEQLEPCRLLGAGAGTAGC
jgi:hypothetical protein